MKSENEEVDLKYKRVASTLMKEMGGTFAKMRGGGDKFQCVVK